MRTSRTQRFLPSGAFSIGAALAAAVLFGATAVAPLSMSHAFASEGSAAAFETRQFQTLVSEAAETPTYDVSLPIMKVSEPKAKSSQTSSKAEVTLDEFMFSGVVNWGGYRFTFYSQQVLPGGGLEIPGRHVSDAGYVTDSDGYIALAGEAPKGTVVDTPFGAQGKIYDRGTYGSHLDVYVR
ncbi:MAG: hypothetical protein ACTHW9_03845 [Canibacter sp.]